MDDIAARLTRNIGILAHVDAGKTSLTERVLHVAGVRRDAGDVDSGDTVTDYLSVERSRGITVKAAAVRFDWGGFRFHLIDTPGHVDFGTEVDRAIRVLDGAVIAICAVSGVQARTEVVVKASAGRNLPRICFVNKMDRRGADFDRVVDELRSSLEPGAIAVQMPWFEGGVWRGVVDLLRMQAFPSLSPVPGVLSVSAGADVPVPEALKAEAALRRSRIVEALAEFDPQIMDDFVSGREILPESLIAALGDATRSCAIVPVLCGTAFSDDSVLRLLKAVADFLPSAQEAGCPEGIDPRNGDRIRREARPDALFSAFVFKTLGDPEGGLFSWTRIWSGKIEAGDRILDARSLRMVKVRRLFGIHAERMEPVDRAQAGDIVALSLRDVRPKAAHGAAAGEGGPDPAAAGASLCDPSAPLLYEAFVVPETVVSLVLEPAASGELAALREALRSLAAGDAALKVSEEGDTGRFEISGLGELHLEVAVERLSREYGVKVRTGKPRVTCKETPARSAAGDEDFDRDFGGERVRARVAVRLSPIPGGIELGFAEGLKPPASFAAAARRGAAGALSVGPSEGWPVDGAAVLFTELVPPSGSGGRNAETAVEAAAAIAVRKALLDSGSKVLEPVMRLDVETPESCFGAVLAELNTRGARIESVDDTPEGKAIVAMAPLRLLFGFAGALRSASSGKAGFQARFGRYEVMPKRSS
ncbi:MAG: GTP-binding protein [Rectinemataceae bacterium]